ncbi:MAG: hypothetical protein ACOCRV_02245 [bacterium]
MVTKEELKKEFLLKDSDINREKEKIINNFKKLEVNQKKLDSAASLIDNAAFMAATLKELQELIKEVGPVTTYKNGENQFGSKQSDEIKTYLSMINKYNSVMKQLFQMLPNDDVDIEKIDVIEEFANSRPD